MSRGTNLLRRGIAAARAGRKQEAEQLLRQVIAEDPDNEWAWFWLSAAVEGIDAQRECLHRVLEINPDNGYARSGLAFLSRVRPGQEWQAEDAPWTVGIDESVMGGTAPPRRCPRCGLLNPGWAYTCSRCGAVLQTIDLVKVVQQEERVYSRTSAGLSVVEAWASAIALKGSAAFGPEVELASWRRALSALVIGSLFFVLLRNGIPALVWMVGPKGMRPVSALSSLLRLLEIDVWRLGEIWIAALTLTLLLFPLARLMGGSGSFRVHFHLLSVAVSAWMFVTSVLVCLLWLLFLTLPDQAEFLLFVPFAVVFLSLCYLPALLTQALRVAHGIAGILALTGVIVGLGVLVAAIVAIGPPLPDVVPAVLRVILGDGLSIM